MRKTQPIPGYTQHARGGFYRSYKGRSLYCGGPEATRKELDETYLAKCKKVDAGERLTRRHGPPTLREVSAAFLAHMRKRRDTGKPEPLEQRTYANYCNAVNDFGKFVGGDVAVRDIGPAKLAEYAGRFGHWAPSGYDSVVSRISALFRWAKEMEYIDRFRPGPGFQRPPRREVLDRRIMRRRSFTANEIARLYALAGPTARCWIGLGACAAFNNSDIANLPRNVIDLDAGVVDFRRRKTGKVRRVCPLPADVVADLKAYHRPEPTDPADAGLFFLTRHGHPFSRTGKNNGNPSDSISRLFAKLIRDADVEVIPGRNFAGLRTSFANLAPPGFRDEVEVIMGHARGSVLLDHYVENVDMDRLRHVVSHVWASIKNEYHGPPPPPESATAGAAPGGSAVGPAPAA